MYKSSLQDENVDSDIQLVLVDESDNVVGSKGKVSCHLGDGSLHRAFSILLFNRYKQLLVQKRSQHKMLWPGYWSNSCCSHPNHGEVAEAAVHRRLAEELGVKASIHYLYKFTYRERYKNIGVEHEICRVYSAVSDYPVSVNPAEIDDYRYMSIDAVSEDITRNPDLYTPWFKIEWQYILDNHLSDIYKQIDTLC